MSLLQVQDVTKNYNGLPILKGVNLQVNAGEILAIVGRSGAGKSTLLHIIGALDTPTSGTVSLGGTNYASLRNIALSRFRNLQLGFIFQFHNLLAEFTALENVCLPGYIAGHPPAKVQAHAHELLSMLGVSHRTTHKPSQLSGGEQQRVAVARALINSPSLVLADEPSGNLDSENADALHQLFLQLRQSLGTTFVIVTHNNHLAGCANRVATMVDGVLNF